MQRERGNSKEINRKLETMKAKNLLLRTQNMELANKLSETQTAAYRLQRMQSEMETSLEAKQNQIKGLTERAEKSIRADLRVAALTDLLKQKEAEVEEMKQQLQKLDTQENNTTQAATSRTPTDSTEGTEASNANEANSEQNEAAPKGEWMQLQTNIDDDASKDSGEASDEVLDDHQTENPTNSQEKESSEEGQEMSKEGASDAEQSKEIKNGEGKADSEASKEKEAEKSRETEMSQESTTDVQKQSKQSQNGQEASSDMEKSELVAAQLVEQEKLENPQDGSNEHKVASEEPTKDAADKEHRVRRRKSRGKGRRQRKAASSIKQDNRDETKGNNEVQDEQKQQALDAPKSEVREGSQVAGSVNGEGQQNSETVAEPVSSNQQLENVQSQEERKEGSKVQGDSSTTVTPEEENERISTQEPEIPEDKEGKNENTEKESNVKKQITKEEVDAYTTSISRQTGSDDTSAGKAIGSNVQRESTNKTVEAESAEKPENSQRDEAKTESIDETRASTAEKEGAAQNQNGMGTEEGGNTASITEQQDTNNAGSEQQTSQIENNTGNNSTKDEEDKEEHKEHEQDNNSQDTT